MRGEVTHIEHTITKFISTCRQGRQAGRMCYEVCDFCLCQRRGEGVGVV